MEKTPQYIKFILILLVAIIIVLFGLLFLQFNVFRQSGGFRLHQPWQNFGQYRRTFGPADVKEVQSWMTFDYINKVFNLPPEYLKNKFSISDSKYPRISLAGYAKNHNIDISNFLSEVKDAIVNYSNSK
jgi:hypothetical protein